MNLRRFVSDLGNSTSQFMIDGHYFEMPSSCTEISRAEAESVFAGNIDQEDIINNLVVRVRYEDQDRYFKVGSIAARDAFADDHIQQLHDKTESIKTFVNWMAAVAFYHAYKSPDPQEDEVSIQYCSTLLPVWLLKRAPKFKMMLDKMASRFIGDVGEVELLTPGYERVLHIHSKESECRIEGETGRFALSRGLDLRPLESASQFNDCIVIMNDLGGQTHDMSKLKPGLKRPGGSHDFASNTDQTYLQHLENLRKTKLMTHFSNLRSLEKFIEKNIHQKKYVFISSTTGQQTDFTEIIDHSLSQFARIVVENSLHAFSLSSGQAVKFVWIGGVAPLLKDYISAYIADQYGEQILKENHVFPENARLLNIYGLEIIAKDRDESLEVIPNDEKTGSIHA